LSNTGVFNYEAEGDPGITMTGSITVSNIQSPVTSSNTVDDIGIRTSIPPGSSILSSTLSSKSNGSSRKTIERQASFEIEGLKP
jgi:hypothetical protein